MMENYMWRPTAYKYDTHKADSLPASLKMVGRKPYQIGNFETGMLLLDVRGQGRSHQGVRPQELCQRL